MVLNDVASGRLGIILFPSEWKSSFRDVWTYINQCFITPRMDIDVCCELSFDRNSVM